MEFAKIVVFMIPLMIIISEVSTIKPETMSIYPHMMLKKITKRHADTRNSRTSLIEFKNFVEDKLIQHSQALEHLLKLVNEAINAINAIAKKIESGVEEEKIPETNTRRMAMENRIGHSEEVSDHPIVKFGKDVEKYGVFFRDIIMKALQNHNEPIPVVARKF